MTDIVKRLREGGGCSSDIGCCDVVLNEAAHEIERLRQQNAELLEVMRFYNCKCKDVCECKLDWLSDRSCGYQARDALAKATGGE